MFRFLGQKILFKAVPGPVTRLSKGILRSVHTSQSGVVGSAGTDGSLQFWLDRLEKERLEFSKERRQEAEETRKETKEARDRIEGYWIQIERNKVYLASIKTSLFDVY